MTVSHWRAVRGRSWDSRVTYQSPQFTWWANPYCLNPGVASPIRYEVSQRGWSLCTSDQRAVCTPIGDGWGMLVAHPGQHEVVDPRYVITLSLLDVDIDCSLQHSFALALGEQYRNLSFFFLFLNGALTWSVSRMQRIHQRNCPASIFDVLTRTQHLSNIKHSQDGVFHCRRPLLYLCLIFSSSPFLQTILLYSTTSLLSSTLLSITRRLPVNKILLYIYTTFHQKFNALPSLRSSLSTIPSYATLRPSTSLFNNLATWI